MDTRLAPADAAFLLPATTAAQERVRDQHLAAAQAYQSGLLRAAARLLARLSGWASRARARAELEALGDRELADIGISRSDIARVLAEPEPTTSPRPTNRPANLSAAWPA